MTVDGGHLAVWLDDAVLALEKERASLVDAQEVLDEALNRIDEALGLLCRDDPLHVAAEPIEPRPERPALPSAGPKPTPEGWARAAADATAYVDSLRLRCPVAGCDKQRPRNVQGLRIHLTNGHRGPNGTYLARARREELMDLAERAAAGETIYPVTLTVPPPTQEPAAVETPLPSPVGGFEPIGDLACPAEGCEFSSGLERRLDRHLRDDHAAVYGGSSDADVEYRAEAVRQARKAADEATA